jgi:phosphoribosylglycinamide formyltransferase-1
MSDPGGTVWIEGPLRLAVLISGSGRTLANISQAIADGELRAEIACVISSRQGVYGIERAQKLGIPTHVVPRKSFASAADFSDAVYDIIRKHKANFVCLAGFLSLLSIPEDYKHRVLNIHPALLPAFGGPGMFGHHVHEAVLEAGCKVSGCTVHFCDDTYDTGPILVQRTCPVHDDDSADSLADRVFEQECLAYPQALKLIASGRVQIRGCRTITHLTV